VYQALGQAALIAGLFFLFQVVAQVAGSMPAGF